MRTAFAWASQRTASWGILGFAYLAFALYLLAPLLIIVVMSFKEGAFVGFPIERWTTRWYLESLADREVIAALAKSLYIAAISTALALVVGTWSAVLLASGRLFAAPLLFALVCLPLVVPAVVSAISMRMFTQSLGIRPGTTAIIIAHASHSVPYVALMVLTRLNSMPRHLTEAARDLGADPLVAFLRATVPYLMPALIGGAIFAMLSSFDDFVRAFFLGSFDPTLPVLIYARINMGVTPGLAAISTMVLAVTILLGLLAERLVRKMR